MTMVEVVQAARAPASVPPVVAPAVAASGISFSYNGRTVALDEVSLTVGAGEVCMILGPSGSGKSTFLKTVKGQLRPRSGSLLVLGRPAGEAGPSRQVATIPQSLGLVRSLSVLDNVLTGALGCTRTLPSLLGLFPPAAIERAGTLLDSLGIAGKAGEKVYCLSGGERQRVAIARALMPEPRLILADEFVSQLDPVTTRSIMAIIRSIAARGVTFLVTSHEIDLVSEFGDRAVFFRSGRAVHECAASDVSPAAVARLLA